MKMKLTTGIIYVVIAFVVIGIVWSATRPRPGESVLNQGNRHLSSAEDGHDPYNSKPPTSGPHLGGKAPWGVATEQISDELQIHNLEDGGVIIHYDPERTDEGVKTALASIVNDYQEKVILEPYAGLETPIVLTAWTRIDKLDTLDEKRIRAFIGAFRGIDHHVR